VGVEVVTALKYTKVFPVRVRCRAISSSSGLASARNTTLGLNRAFCRHSLTSQSSLPLAYLSFVSFDEPGEELTHTFPVEIDTLEYSRVKCYIGIFCALADSI
jgi:hypothetical protein